MKDLTDQGPMTNVARGRGDYSAGSERQGRDESGSEVEVQAVEAAVVDGGGRFGDEGFGAKAGLVGGPVKTDAEPVQGPPRVRRAISVQVTRSPEGVTGREKARPLGPTVRAKRGKAARAAAGR